MMLLLLLELLVIIHIWVKEIIMDIFFHMMIIHHQDLIWEKVIQ